LVTQWRGKRAASFPVKVGIAREADLQIMDALTVFGLFAVTAMLICYALEARSHWFVLAFAGACALGSAYGFLQGAWPFGVVEAVWAAVAMRRWFQRSAS
jgi:hypothetical protein